MKQVLMDGGKPVLPEDIIRNILKRLPVKDLIRSQCVCKNWKNRIKTPSFIAEHIQYNTHHNPCLLFQGGGRSKPSGWCFLNHEMQLVKAQSEPLIGSLSGVRIVGSINGLICFHSNNSSIFLWNPATREVRQVAETVNYPVTRDFHTGFGFSSMISDYKVVIIHVSWVNWRVIRSKECSLGTTPVNQVHVYSLSTGSWNEMEFGNLDDVYFLSNGFSFNGAIYWLGIMLNVGEQDENDHLVISFDIATEVFTLISLPSSVPKSTRNRLAMYENKLAMVCHTTLGNAEFLVDLWVMEEGTGASGRWNWTKKYTTGSYLCYFSPGTILRNEIVCSFVGFGAARHEVNEGEQKVGRFNITTNEFKTFAIPKYCKGADSVFNYVESLVSVGNNHIEEF